jgi:hypothetical protein
MPASEFCIITKEGEAGGSYKFDCNICEKTVIKAAEPRILELLRTKDIDEITWKDLEVDHELRQRFVEGGESPINHDELIDFHDGLEGDEWMRELGLAGPEGPEGSLPPDINMA